MRATADPLKSPFVHIVVSDDRCFWGHCRLCLCLSLYTIVKSNLLFVLCFLLMPGQSCRAGLNCREVTVRGYNKGVFNSRLDRVVEPWHLLHSYSFTSRYHNESNLPKRFGPQTHLKRLKLQGGYS